MHPTELATRISTSSKDERHVFTSTAEVKSCGNTDENNRQYQKRSGTIPPPSSTTRDPRSCTPLPRAGVFRVCCRSHAVAPSPTPPPASRNDVSAKISPPFQPPVPSPVPPTPPPPPPPPPPRAVLAVFVAPGAAATAHAGEPLLPFRC